MGVTSLAPPPPLSSMREVISAALREDLAFGDLTSTLLIPPTLSARAKIIAKDHMMIAGVAVARHVFHAVDPSLDFTTHTDDGTMVHPSTPILTIRGKAQSLLQGERVALNFLQRLSGISTLTRQYCEAVRDYPVAIVDTRKTTPGLRALEKWAVRLGGGHNHRFSLHDGILIKDNHLMVLAVPEDQSHSGLSPRQTTSPSWTSNLRGSGNYHSGSTSIKGKSRCPLIGQHAPGSGPTCHRHHSRPSPGRSIGRHELEQCSGYGQSRSGFISIGALTHSAPSMDLSMEIVALQAKKRPQKRKSKA
jgi:nicotinate-nucleotide pyrophosphorylase (carboxylating)